MTADSFRRRLGDVVLHKGPLYNQLDAALARVLALHHPWKSPTTGAEYCDHCSDETPVPYPCPTIQAIEEQP